MSVLRSPYAETVERVAQLLEAQNIAPVVIGLVSRPDMLPLICIVPGSISAEEGGPELGSWGVTMGLVIYAWVSGDVLEALDVQYAIELCLQADRTLGYSDRVDWRIDTVQIQGQSYGGGELIDDSPAVAVIACSIEMARFSPDQTVI